MKNYFPAIAVLLAALGVAVTLRSPKNSDEYDAVAFGQLPTLVNGRVKPIDTVARTSLLVMQGRQRVKTFEGRTLSPSEWLLDVLYRPDVANTYPVFEIVNPDVLALFDLTTERVTAENATRSPSSRRASRSSIANPSWRTRLRTRTARGFSRR